jgi:hypothetical protein
VGSESIDEVCAHWLSRLSATGGLLVPAARAYLERFHARELGVFRPGPAGLKQLAQSMELWLEREVVDAAEEHAFVEGAGALLGLLLIDHVGDAAHATRDGLHRVRLRKHGFFDPFAAIDRVLDADNLRQALVREVHAAEAEAEGHGPLSRVVHALAAELRSTHPELSITEQFEHQLRLAHGDRDQPLELDLARAVDATRDQDEDAVRTVVRRYLSLLPGAELDPAAFAEMTPRLLPRIAQEAMLADLGTGASELFRASLSDELCVAIVEQLEGRARYLRAAEVRSGGIAPAMLVALALQNLEARSSRARIVTEGDGEARMLMARSGDGLDSARVLLPQTYPALAERLGDAVCVAIPHRDTFLACSARSKHALAQLAERAEHDAARAPHRLSARLFRLTTAGLTRLE